MAGNFREDAIIDML